MLFFLLRYRQLIINVLKKSIRNKKYFKKYLVYKINLFIFAVYFKPYKLYHHGTTTRR
ncbi:hypothetical protein HMPREF1551_00406 [Capnocytophaga sp. oral taxon 863 str. F0517]|nr:hypothetical protein HMPREF1551_00406 [Capnocytophaga sp. oral taxon 863 str. F0517]